MFSTHGGEWAETAGTAGSAPACVQCDGELAALIDVTSGYHDRCGPTGENDRTKPQPQAEGQGDLFAEMLDGAA